MRDCQIVLTTKLVTNQIEFLRAPVTVSRGVTNVMDCESVTKSVPCPACPRMFETSVGAWTHLGMSLGCLERHRTRHIKDQPTSKRHKTDRLAEAFQKDQRVRASDELHDLREDRGVGDAGIQQVKDAVRSLLDVAEAELVRRLALLEKKCSDVGMRTIVHEVLDVFNGLE